MPHKQRLTHLLTVVIPAINISMLEFEQWNSDCGTKYCLGGYAALDPTFNEEGLSFCKMNGDEDSPNVISYNGIYGWPAIEAFFGLDVLQSDLIFGVDQDFGKTVSETLEKRKLHIRDIINQSDFEEL